MKVYEKPRIYIESFELSQHIAACAWDMSNSKTVEECSAESDSDIIFVDGIHAFIDANPSCTDGPVEGYCYTNSGSAVNIFNS